MRSGQREALKHTAVQWYAARFLRRLSVLLIVSVLLGSCRRCADAEGYVEIGIEWSDGIQPRPVLFLFYNEEGVLVKEAACSTGSYQGALPEGVYRLIVHNTDAERICYRAMERFETAEAFVEYLPTPSSQGMRPIHEPGMVYATGCCCEFPELRVVSRWTLSATVAPRPLTRTVTFQFRVANMDHVMSVTGRLHGVPQGIFLASGSCNTATSCCVGFTAEPQTRAAGSYATQISIFDLLTQKDSPAGTNRLEVTLTDVNGVEHIAEADITDFLKGVIDDNDGEIPADIPIDVRVELKPIEGMTVSVAPWDDSGAGSGDPRPEL